jgi:hypothetical protein
MLCDVLVVLAAGVLVCWCHDTRSKNFYRKLFSKMDTDHDEKLTMDEFQPLLRRHFFLNEVRWHCALWCVCVVVVLVGLVQTRRRQPATLLAKSHSRMRVR